MFILRLLWHMIRWSHWYYKNSWYLEVGWHPEQFMNKDAETEETMRLKKENSKLWNKQHEHENLLRTCELDFLGKISKYEQEIIHLKDLIQAKDLILHNKGLS